MLIIPSLRQLPVGINGISLCTCGVGVLLRVFIPLYSDSDANVIILVLLFISLILASLYILKCILFFKETLLSDWNLPIQIGGIGSLSIAFIVQGSLFYDSLGEPSLSLYWLLLATAFIVFINIVFLRSCIVNKVPPEPFYHTSVFNSLFVPAFLPSDPYYCVIIRDIFFVYGLIMAVTIVPTSAYRILFLKDEQMTPRVARNPTCAIQQSAWAVCSAAWLKHPISFSGVDVQKNKGVEVLHFFFVLAQVGYIVTINRTLAAQIDLSSHRVSSHLLRFHFPLHKHSHHNMLVSQNLPEDGCLVGSARVLSRDHRFHGHVCGQGTLHVPRSDPSHVTTEKLLGDTN